MKYQIITIDSNKSDIINVYKDIYSINLNALIKRKIFDTNTIKHNIEKFLTTIDKDLFGNHIDKTNIKYINPTNLASLCYKLQINYDSIECLEFVNRILETLKNIFPNYLLTQKRIWNDGEIDLQPFNSLVEIDNIHSIIYINKILKDKLKVLGYVDSQLCTLTQELTMLNQLLPGDMLNDIPFNNTNNLNSYNYIKGLFN